MKKILLLVVVFLPFTSKSQSPYAVSQTDFIFSMASMNTTTIVSTSPVVRFSGFINHEWQAHFDFGKSVGLYTGLGLRNIGMINHFDNTGINYKQRAYSLGVPLAIKLGNIKKEAYIAMGGEANLMTHYKEKFLFGDSKVKSSEWFSNKLNMFNPAVFLQVKFLKTQVITIKYYLNDFLRYQSSGLLLPNSAVIADYGRTSKLFYISWGASLSSKYNEAIEEKKNIKTARWVE